MSWLGLDLARPACEARERFSAEEAAFITDFCEAYVFSDWRWLGIRGPKLDWLHLAELDEVERDALVARAFIPYLEAFCRTAVVLGRMLDWIDDLEAARVIARHHFPWTDAEGERDIAVSVWLADDRRPGGPRLSDQAQARYGFKRRFG